MTAKINNQIFPDGEIYFYAFARMAIYDIVNSILKESDDNILIPDFICDTVVKPLNVSKKKYYYYKIDENLNVNLNDLKQKINKNTKIILVVNYFGMQQNILDVKKITDKTNIFLLEDNTHRLFSRANTQILGSIGDLSILSFRKTLPVKKGAALIINSKYFLGEFKYSPKNYNKNSDKIFEIGCYKYFKQYMKRNFRCLFYLRNFIYGKLSNQINKDDLFEIEENIININKVEFKGFILKYYYPIVKRNIKLYLMFKSYFINKTGVTIFNCRNEDVPIAFPFISKKNWEGKTLKSYVVRSWPSLPSDSPLNNELKNIYWIYFN